MKYQTFFESVINAIHPNSKNKQSKLKALKMKVPKSLIEQGNYSRIEENLGISMNIFNENNYSIYRSQTIKKKHANLLLSNNDSYKPIMIGGNQLVGVYDNIFNSISVNLEMYVKKHLGIYDQEEYYLDQIDNVELEVLMSSFLPHEKELRYMLAVLPYVEDPVIKQMLNREDIRTLLVDNKEKPLLTFGGGASARTNRKQPPQTSESSTNTDNNLSVVPTNIINFEVRMSLAKFLKLIVMICFVAAMVLNPLMRYAGFNRLLDLQGPMNNSKSELKLPNFYANDYFSKQGGKKMSHEIVQITSLNDGRTQKLRFTSKKNMCDLSPIGNTFIKVLENPSYLMINVLPHIKFTDFEMVESLTNDQRSDYIKKQAVVYEKLYNSLLVTPDEEIQNNIANMGKISTCFKNNIADYVMRLFKKPIQEVNVHSDVVDLLNGAISKMYDRKKDEVLQYNRDFLRRFKSQLVDLVILYQNNLPSERDDKLDQIQTNFAKEYDERKALEKVRAMKRCLSLTDDTRSDQIVNNDNISRCIQSDILTDRDIRYAVSFQRFKIFFNNIGLMYNEMSSSAASAFSDDTVKMIKENVHDVYHDYLHVGLQGFQNQFYTILIDSMNTAQLTETEATIINNFKMIGGMNLFDLFLDMYSSDLSHDLAEIIPGTKTIIKFIRNTSKLINEKTAASISNVVNRIMIVLENDIRLKEALFYDSSYYTDTILNLMKNANRKTSISNQVVKSFSDTNFELLIEIKMKNFILQLMKMLKANDKTNQNSDLNSALTDLFYIIPYYTYKYKDSIDMTGGGKRKKRDNKNKS